jgi:aminoglycoside phosphotransferase (APT) family kinase protein
MSVDLEPPPRTNAVTAIIQRADGKVLLVRDGGGWSLPSVETRGHWYAEVAPFNAAILERYGIAVTFLRTLSHQLDEAANSARILIAFAARADDRTEGDVRWVPFEEAIDAAAPGDRDAIAAWSREPDQDPQVALRRPWYRPGWRDVALAWCAERLAKRGIALTGPAEQSKHWSIASIWRIPTDRGDVWLKAVPPFFAHEGTLLQFIAPSMPEHLPRVIATDRERGLLLMESFPQRSLWGAHDGAANDRAARILARIQQYWAARIDDLLAAGCVDRRISTLDGALEAVLARDVVRERFTDDEVRRLLAFGETVPARVEALRECGLPETLMHGDFHPGNVAVDGERLVIFDWTDGCVSYPFFDLATYNPRDPVEHAAVTQAFIEAWSSTVDEAAVARAAEIAQPLACVHHATSYMRLLDNIHGGDQWELDSDVLFWLHWLRAIIE